MRDFAQRSGMNARDHFPHARAISRRYFSRLRQSVKFVSRFVFIDK